MSIKLESNNLNVEEKFKKLFIADQIEQEKKIKTQEDKISSLQLAKKELYSDSIYNFFMTIRKEYILLYFFLLLIIYNFIDRINYTQKNIISLGITVFILYLINNRNEILYTTDMDLIEQKLNAIIPQPKYFYKDAGMINLVYSMKEFRSISHKIWDEMIETIDLFFENEELLYNDENENYNNIYNFLLDNRKKTLNILASFIHNIRVDRKFLINKLEVSLESMHYILNIHVKNARIFVNDYIKDNSINRKLHEINEYTEMIGYEKQNDYYDVYS